MSDKLNSEEMMLDEFVMKAEKEDIPVPQELEDRMRQRIAALKPRKHYIRNTIAACVSLCILFAGGVRFNSSFAAYAASVPGLTAAVEWIRGDEGIENARNNGYKELGSVRVEEDGYVLDINRIMMDEDRIVLLAKVSGEKIEQMNKDIQNPEIVEKEATTDSRPKYTGLDLVCEFTSFRVSGVSMTNAGNDRNELARDIEATFTGDEVERFLEKSSQFINMIVKVRKAEEVIYTFQPVKIPFDKSNFMSSRTYMQDVKLTNDHTGISIRKLTVSPTRMKLDMSFDMEEGYSFTGFENPCITDEKGNTYRPEGLISMSADPGKQEQSIYFVPSVYFGKVPEKLYFSYDGIRIASDEGRRFKLALKDTYPKTLDYMGQKIIIEQVSWEKDKGLRVAYTGPDPDVLSVQNLELIGYHDASGFSTNTADSKVQKLEVMFYYAEEQDVYELEFAAPGYLIRTNSSCELNLKQ